MRFVLVLISLWVLSGSASAQLNCTGALTLYCGQTVAGTTVSGCGNSYVGPYCGSNNVQYTGNERVYQLTVSSLSTVMLDLTALSADLDLFLLSSCSASACVAASTNVGNTANESIAATLSPGTYYVVIDGWAGANSTFLLSATCVPGDGQPDCATATPLTCGANISGTTASGCTNNVVGPYCGANWSNYTGNEKVYSFTLSTQSIVTITVSGLLADLDVFLLSTCNRSSCAGYSVNNGTNAEQIVKTLAAGTYYIVLDGYNGCTSSFLLSLSCSPTGGSGTTCTDCTNCFDYSFSGDTLKLNNRYCNASGSNLTFEWSFSGWSPVIYTNTPAGMTCKKPTANGTYEVCMKVKNSNTGATLYNCCQKIVVNTCTDPPLAFYTYTDMWQHLNFTANTVPGAQYTWEFGHPNQGTDNNVSTSSPTIAHDFPTMGNFTVCLTVNGPCGMSRFCRNIYVDQNPPAGCTSAPMLSAPVAPQINGYTASFASLPISTSGTAYKWEWGDGTSSATFTNSNPVLSHTYPGAGTYLMKLYVYWNNGTTVCHRVCATWTVKVSAAPPPNCNDLMSYFYAGNGTDLKFRLKFNTPSGGTFLTWKINGVAVSSNPDQIVIFPNANVYSICADYKDAGNVTRTCCRQLCISLPGNCQQLINYAYVNGKFVLSLAGNTGNYTNITWRNDTDGIDNIDPNNVAADCRTLNISVRFFDIASQCWTLCCRQISFCPPNNCQNAISYAYVAATNAFQFTLNVSGATGVVWKFEETGQVLPNGLFVLPSNWQCQDLTVTALYFDPQVQCWRMCSRKVNICPPVNCQTAIQYTYVAVGNKFRFTLNVPGATGLVWKFDEDGTVLPNGEFVIPTGWVCKDRTVTVQYFDPQTQCWRICCRKVYICPPVNCQDAIQYAYVSIGNKFKFTLNVSGATNLSWKFEEDGTPLPNGEFTIPAGWQCKDRTVSVQYFDPQTQCWRVCSRKVYICPPVNCELAIQFNYDAMANKFKFSLNVSGATNLSWSFEEGNTPLPNGEFVLPPNWQCDQRTVVVVYFNPQTQCWQTCSRKVWLCPATSCQDAIQFTYVASGNKFKFTLNNPYATNISWRVDDDNTPLPNGEFVMPAGWQCQAKTISVYYLYPAIQCWQVCCRKVWICPPQNCQDAIQYSYVALGNKFKFTLAATNVNNVTWKFENDSTPLPNGEFVLPAGWQCQERVVQVYYLDLNTNIWKVCSRRVWICPPSNCQDAIQFSYDPAGNKYRFTLGIPGATGVVWRFENDPNTLPNGEFVLPAGWICQEKTITVQYLDPQTQCWRVCSRKVYLCPPSDCQDAIQYAYVEQGGKFRFTLNIPGATVWLWRFEEDGTLLPNGEFVLPAGWQCKDRTVTVQYIDPQTQCLKICSRKVYICPPLNCSGLIAHTYSASGSTVSFSLNGSTAGLSNISWWVEDTGQSLGSGTTSQSLTVPSPCAERTISVRYLDGGVWRICCKRILLCNPFDCTSAISYKLNTDTLWLSLSGNHPDVSWRDQTNNRVIGSGNPVQYIVPAGSSVITVCVSYRDTTTNCYKTCYKDIAVGNCPPPVASFRFTVNGNVVTFVNTSTNASTYIWNFNGGTPANGTTTSSANPVVTFNTGAYTVCLTATNNCGSRTFCQPLQVSTGNELVFDIDDQVCGSSGQEVLVPVRVRQFRDILSYNFTIRVSDTAVAEIVNVEQFNAAVQAGSYYFVQKDHLRMFWSDPMGRSLPDSTAVFAIRVRLKSGAFTNLVFSDVPVKMEAFDKDQKMLTVIALAGSVCLSSQVVLEGQIYTEENNPVGQVKVRPDGNVAKENTTGADGKYVLGGLSTGANCTIVPYKNTDPLNGINALDIVRLQRHLLRLDILTSPYKLIAADVNHDRAVNALDVVVLQRLQLRIIDTFPNNTSWRFVPGSYTFTTSDPLTENYPEIITHAPLTGSQSNQNFYGIKTGDLNGSANASSLVAIEDRSAGDTVGLVAAGRYGLYGQDLQVPVTCRNFKKLVALESTLQWDNSVLEYTGVGGFNLPSLSANNFGDKHAANGVLTFSWFDVTTMGVTVPDNAVLFNLKFKVKGLQGTGTEVAFGNNPVRMLAADSSLQALPLSGSSGTIRIVASQLAMNYQAANTRCKGSSDGSIALAVGGGSGSYGYRWNNGTTEAVAVGLSEGIYRCTVTDVATGVVRVTPDMPVASPPQLEVAVSAVADNGQGSGSVAALATGGVPPYRYEWSNKLGNSAVITGVSAGTYRVTVVDANGCSVVGTSEVILPVQYIALEEVRVYPNPTTGLINVELRTAEVCDLHWTLVNVLGQRVLEQSGVLPDCRQFGIDASGLADGVYRLLLETERARVALPVVLMKR